MGSAASEGRSAFVAALLNAGACDGLPARNKRPPGASATEPSALRPRLSLLHLSVANAPFALAAQFLDASADPTSPTAAALRDIMAAAGVSTQLEENLDPQTVR